MRKGVIKRHVPDKIYEPEITSWIVETEMVVAINGGLLVMENDGTWHHVTDREAKIWIRSLFEDPEWQNVLGDGLLTNIIKNLKTHPYLQKEKDEFRHSGLLMVKNGIWDISTEAPTVHSTKEFFKRRIDVCITSELPQEPTVFVQFCKIVFSEDMFEIKKQILYEIIGYCISDAEPAKKGIFLIGPPNCGKSVILMLIQMLVGERDVSNVSLSGFGQKFSVAEMYGKSLNVSGEIPSGALSGAALDNFKSITGGDRIQVERKGCQPFSTVLDTKLIFAGNMLPMFSNVDGTDALIERMHILIFDIEVPECEQDKELLDKLWTERNAIVRYALHALKEFEKRGRTFLNSSDEIELLKSLRQAANPIPYFLQECMELGVDYAVYISDAYEAYSKFAANEALSPLKPKEFRNLMVTQPGITVGNKRRLNKKPPKSCFEGIRLKENMYYDGQDTDLNDTSMGGNENDKE